MGDQQSSPITRRTIAKGIAWSVPAFALATAAPALAQSPLITFDVGGAACKYPGGSEGVDLKHGYLFPVAIENLSNEKVCIEVTGATIDVGDGPLPGGVTFWNAPPTEAGATKITGELCLEVDAPPITYYVVVTGAGNSANQGGTAYVNILVTGEDTERQYADVASAPFSATPPDC